MLQIYMSKQMKETCFRDVNLSSGWVAPSSTHCFGEMIGDEAGKGKGNSLYNTQQTCSSIVDMSMNIITQ